MLRNKLLLGSAVSIAVLSVGSATAMAESFRQSTDVQWTNIVNVQLSQNITVNKSLDIAGSIQISGSIEVDGLAQATVDNKQIMKGNDVQFEDYQNAYVPSFSGQAAFWEPAVNDAANGAAPAIYDNNASVGQNTLSVATGNIGLNVAAGDYNMQENVASIAAALSDDPGLDGAAEAQVFSLQSLKNNGFNNERPDASPSASPVSAGFEVENTVITNDATVGNNALTGASGNIGVNVAAGAFNQQKNALAMASIDRGVLAEAHAAIQQTSRNNESVHENTVNNASIGDNSLVGATGNIGVNIAAGVGNQQLNSLSVASAVLISAVAPTPPPGNTGGGGTGGPS
jgi:hypothetical protein